MNNRISTAQRLAVKQALQFAETTPLSVDQLIKLVNLIFNFYNNKEQDGKLH